MRSLKNKLKFRHLALLAFAVFCLSQAGNLIRFADTAAITIVFYRMFFALIFISPFAFNGVRKLPRNTVYLMILMGSLFAVHILTWVMAVQHTKVANAAICFSINPILITLGAFLFFKERAEKKCIIAIVAGILGISIIGYDDFSISETYMIGDLLAVLSALLYAMYFLVGKAIRNTVGNSYLMAIVYLVAAVFSLIFMFVDSAPVLNISAKAWIAMLSLAIFPTILGHASVVYLVKHIKAAVISSALLIEPVFAGLVACLIFKEKITDFTVLGYLVITIGMIPLFFAKRIR